MTPAWLPTVLDVIAPPRCGRCDQEGHWWCLADGSETPWPICLTCQKDWHQSTPQCRNPLPLIHLGHYAEPALRMMIYRWKYAGQWTISQDWASLLANNLAAGTWPAGLLVPIPSHWSRLIARGYNQAKILAEQIGRQTDWPVAEPLRRVRATAPQARLDTRARQKNLADAFQLKTTAITIPEGIWLVDDIVTSGATVTSATQTFQIHGISVHGVLAVARAPVHEQDEADTTNSVSERVLEGGV
ncbi:ComF family protein [Candidatus Berkelbacteria bacterium]|nr:ComF family protein [Candidatus Berkelbacteria bacterium]